MIVASVVGLREVKLDLTATGLLAEKAQKRVIRRGTFLLETRVKAHASGRPGPNAPTGDYRRSIDHDFIELPGQLIGFVGTNAPQGRRLELGFTGFDSLGRYYDQQAYPHFGPALDEVEPLVMADHEREIGEAIK